MENRNKKSYEFVNEFMMNEYTMHEIALGIWTKRKIKNKIPILLYLTVTLVPLIYGMTSEKKGYTLLAAVNIFVGFAGLLTYFITSAYRSKKKWKPQICQTIEECGKEEPLRVCIGENISYCFNGITKVVSYRDIEKMLLLDMYLILTLKNDVILPVWKLGFQEGSWEELVPYVKQKMKQKF